MDQDTFVQEYLYIEEFPFEPLPQEKKNKESSDRGPIIIDIMGDSEEE